jgi:hypothetical protein
MDTQLLDRELNYMSTPAKCVFVLLFLHLFLSLVVLVLMSCLFVSIDNSADTLLTFSVMLPEMQDVLKDLGQITPEIREGLSKINQLCLKVHC